MALEGAAKNLVNKDLAGEKGFEPLHAGIKIQCLNQLGDSPTREGGLLLAKEAGRPPMNVALDSPAYQRMRRQIAAFAHLPRLGGVFKRHIVRHLCENRTS